MNDPEIRSTDPSEPNRIRTGPFDAQGSWPPWRRGWPQNSWVPWRVSEPSSIKYQLVGMFIRMNSVKALSAGIANGDPSANDVTTRDRLLKSATSLVRQHGLHATTVDEVCDRAGVTKGAFFHHFKSKEAMAVEMAESWSVHNEEFFRVAPYHAPHDPLDRVIGYLDFRSSLIVGEPEEFTCLAGTMVQEAYQSHPAIREVCRSGIADHVESLEPDLERAIARYRPGSGLDAKSLALHTQVVLQGAFILAKASSDRSVALDSISHLRNYFLLLFDGNRVFEERGGRGSGDRMVHVDDRPGTETGNSGVRRGNPSTSR